MAEINQKIAAGSDADLGDFAARVQAINAEIQSVTNARIDAGNVRGKR